MVTIEEWRGDLFGSGMQEGRYIFSSGVWSHPTLAIRVSRLADRRTRQNRSLPVETIDVTEQESQDCCHARSQPSLSNLLQSVWPARAAQVTCYPAGLYTSNIFHMEVRALAFLPKEDKKYLVAAKALLRECCTSRASQDFSLPTTGYDSRSWSAVHKVHRSLPVAKSFSPEAHIQQLTWLCQLLLLVETSRETFLLLSSCQALHGTPRYRGRKADFEAFLCFARRDLRCTGRWCQLQICRKLL